MRDIVVYGHGDKTALGFDSEDAIRKYLSGGLFTEEGGRYRYSQKKRADIVVLSRDGYAYGYLVVSSMEPPQADDTDAYPKTRQVYCISKSCLYENKVNLSQLGIRNYQFGKRLSEDQFTSINDLSGTTSFHRN